MPVAATPRQPTHFDAQHHSNVAEADFRKKSLKSCTPFQALPTEPQIVVDDYHLVIWPAKRFCTVYKSVLKLSRLNVLLNLPRAGLAYIDNRKSLLAPSSAGREARVSFWYARTVLQ